MSIIEAIQSRRSVRSFDPEPLSAGGIKKIEDFASSAENPFDLPITWKILSAKESGLSSPVITGTDTYIAGKMKRAPHAEEAFGWSFEKIVLFAQELGIGTTWIAGTMDRAAFEKAMELKNGEVMPCVSPLGRPAKKMSLRETMMRKGVKADSRLSFGELFFSRSFDDPLKEEDAGSLAEALRAVRLAPSAVNRQPWRVVVCGNSFHFYEKHGKGYKAGDGWDIQKIDMGIALCHFMLAAQERSYSPSLTIAEPGISHPADTDYIATVTVE